MQQIFENPQFYVDGATAGDVRQGRAGDCWFLAALGALGNKKDLIEKVCVARDEAVGVYGFVFYRGKSLKIRDRMIVLGLLFRRWQLDQHRYRR